jgi:hypothetical protein
MSFQIAKNNNHESEALARLISQYKDKENFEKLIKIIATRTQEQEEMLYSMYNRFNIANSEGNQLDTIGDIIGQKRFSFTDDIYKLLLYSRIALNTSGGTPENIMSLFTILINNAEIQYIEQYKAGIHLWYASDVVPDEDLINYTIEAINNSLAAGVSLLSYGIFDEENPFYFDEEDTITEDGFGAFGSEDQEEIGGKLGLEIYNGLVVLSPSRELLGGDGSILLGGNGSILKVPFI